jgi:hypothetical protein
LSAISSSKLRYGDGRFAPAAFLPSLHLRSTFPFSEPQAEAKAKHGNQNFLCVPEATLLNNENKISQKAFANFGPKS